MSRKPYRPWSPNQPYLVPPRPSDWLPEDHLVYFLLDVVEELDITAIEVPIQARDLRGVAPYDPRLMVALLLYGYARGVYASRRIERATYEDVAMRFLAGGHHPHFTTIAAFRQDHLEALGALFVQVLRLCEEAGLVKLGHVSLDGTKIQGNASKHSSMSYDRMKSEEARLSEEVKALLASAADADRRDDERLGAGLAEVDVPAELARREARIQRIRAAREALEAEARAARAAELERLAAANQERARANPESKDGRAASTRAANQRAKASGLREGPHNHDRDDDDHDDGSSGGSADPLPRNKPPHDPDGTPDSKAQRNFTDPDSRIMMKGTDVVQAYNAQAAVDADSHVIVSQGLSNQAPDSEYLKPLVDRIELALGRRPEKLSADAGYFSEENARWCHEHGVDPYIATGRVRHGAQAPPGPEAAPPADSPRTQREIMRAKLATKEGHDVYRLRKATPEPVFGNIKEARGFRRFLLRGLEKVREEWSMICTAHNLLKLYSVSRASLS